MHIYWPFFELRNEIQQEHEQMKHSQPQLERCSLLPLRCNNLFLLFYVFQILLRSEIVLQILNYVKPLARLTGIHAGLALSLR